MKQRTGTILSLLRWSCAIALLLWGVITVSSNVERNRWTHHFTASPFESERLDDLESVPNRAGAWRQVTRAATRQVFPRRWDVAAHASSKWIERRPFVTEPWINYGRAKFMAGDREQGLAALEFAEKLSPSFPTPYLEIIPVWILAGERERAFGLARRISSLDGLAPIEVAKVLQSAGIPPTQIWELTYHRKLSPRNSVRLIQAINRHSVPTQDAFFNQIPTELLQDQEFRNLALREFLRPLAPNAIRELWHHEHKSQLEQITVGGGTLLLQKPVNPSIPRDSFHFGWQRPPERIARSVVNRQEGGRTSWRVSYRDETPQQAWLLHRGLFMDGTAPLMIEVVLRHTEGTANPHRMILVTPGGEVTGTSWVSPNMNGEIRLREHTPPVPREGILEVRLQKARGVQFQPAMEMDILSIHVSEMGGNHATP